MNELYDLALLLDSEGIEISAAEYGVGMFFSMDVQEIASGILAAGYVKPRVITTKKELDALRIGTVILDAKDEVNRLVRKERTIISYPTPIENKWDMGGGMLHLDEMVDLPATVIYEPTE